jgi:hypothetical protein
MGNRWKTQVQLGLEATKGTPVPATARLRVVAGFPEDERVIVFPDEDIGSIPGKDRTYEPELGAKVAFPDAEATFEQLPYIFSAGIEGIVAGVADGAGTDFIYTYTPPVTSQPAASFIKAYTIEGQDDQQAEEIEFCVVEEFTLKGKKNEALMVSSNWFGRQVQLSTFTPALSLPAVEEILFNKGKLFVDEPGGTIGTTQISDSLIEMELKMITGWIPRQSATGAIVFSHIAHTRPVLELSLTFEHDTNAVAEKAKWRTQTARLIRLSFEGTAFGTPGTTYTFKILQIDLAGKWSTFDPLGDDESITIAKGSLTARENDVAALYSNFVVANEVTTLP